MILIALLVLIVCIMLFGAAAVKGVLANTLTLGCAALLILIPILWVGSFIGEDGVIYTVMGILGLLLALAVWVKVTEAPTKPLKPAKPSVTNYHSRAPSREERKKIRDQLRGR